jgi:hypothetical protein
MGKIGETAFKSYIALDSADYIKDYLLYNNKDTPRLYDDNLRTEGMNLGRNIIAYTGLKSGTKNFMDENVNKFNIDMSGQTITQRGPYTEIKGNSIINPDVRTELSRSYTNLDTNLKYGNNKITNIGDVKISTDTTRYWVKDKIFNLDTLKQFDTSIANYHIGNKNYQYKIESTLGGNKINNIGNTNKYSQIYQGNSQISGISPQSNQNVLNNKFITTSPQSYDGTFVNVDTPQTSFWRITPLETQPKINIITSQGPIKLEYSNVLGTDIKYYVPNTVHTENLLGPDDYIVITKKTKIKPVSGFYNKPTSGSFDAGTAKPGNEVISTALKDLSNINSELDTVSSSVTKTHLSEQILNNFIKPTISSSSNTISNFARNIGNLLFDKTRQGSNVVVNLDNNVVNNKIESISQLFDINTLTDNTLNEYQGQSTQLDYIYNTKIKSNQVDLTNYYNSYNINQLNNDINTVLKNEYGFLTPIQDYMNKQKQRYTQLQGQTHKDDNNKLKTVHITDDVGDKKIDEQIIYPPEPKPKDPDTDIIWDTSDDNDDDEEKEIIKPIIDIENDDDNNDDPVPLPFIGPIIGIGGGFGLPARFKMGNSGYRNTFSSNRYKIYTNPIKDLASDFMNTNKIFKQNNNKMSKKHIQNIIS